MKKRVKWEPWALMILMLGIGLWLVWSPISGLKAPKAREGARTVELRVGNSRGIVEVFTPQGQTEPAFRMLLRDGHVSNEMSATDFKAVFGEQAYTTAAARQPSHLFRVLNITSWGGLLWVSIGFFGQIAFTGRTLVQWLVSEKRRESVVPELFWWLSLAGGSMLFTYFVWRQDFVGVLGQSSGVVIYARNLRLIYKARRRAGEAAHTNLATSVR
jgi:lipid-A-disaccharide synthase-like uncharacterized protein